jgi:hypothetical protein
VLATLSTERTATLIEEGEARLEALTGGFHLAYVIGAACALVAIVTAVTVLREGTMEAMAAAHGEPEGAHAEASGEPVYDRA